MRTGRLQSVYHRPTSRGAMDWLAGGLPAIAARSRAAEEDAHLEAALEAALKFVLAKPSGAVCAFYGVGDALAPAIEHAAAFLSKSSAACMRFIHFQDTLETRSAYGGEVEIEPCAGPLSGERIFELCSRLDLPRAAIIVIDPRQEHAIEAMASLIGITADEGSILILRADTKNEAIMPRLLTGNGWAPEVLLRFGQEREGRVLALRPRTPHLDVAGHRALATPP